MLDNQKLANLFPDIADPSLNNSINTLNRLRENPPQVLLFDGGTEAKRRTLAHYWAACNLCSNFQNGPCLECQTCVQVANDVHRDILAFDGYITKTEDEDNPGFFRAFNAENARSLKVSLRVAPTSAHRVVFFTGIAGSHPEAPNALLKVLEEPSPHTLFVILVPQRAQILPTLVSRSLCLTLPWPDELNTETAEVAELTQSLAGFLRNQENFLNNLSGKGAMPLPLAKELLIALQKTCIRVLAGSQETRLDQELANLSQVKIIQFSNMISEAQKMLLSGSSPVTPPRVLSALAMQLYSLRLN